MECKLAWTTKSLKLKHFLSSQTECYNSYHKFNMIDCGSQGWPKRLQSSESNNMQFAVEGIHLTTEELIMIIIITIIS